MEERQSEDLTRRSTKSHSHRRAMLSLGGVALLSTLGKPSVADAGKRGKRCKKPCQKQVSACETVVRAFCVEEDPGGNGCLQSVMPCCTPLQTCDSATSTQCFIDKLFPTA